MDKPAGLEFDWGGIAFRVLPQPRSGHGSNAPVLLQWRHPSGESGTRRCAGMAEAMRHSSWLIEATAPSSLSA